MEGKARPITTEDATGKPSETVVDLIADLEGLDPVELSPPLYSVVDPEALDALFNQPIDVAAESLTTSHVQFQYRGYTIRVHGDGEVAIVKH